MSKQLLKCDICGGTIEVQTGGTNGICINCGAAYSLERLREIYSGMKVSITGTDEDVVQWRTLAKTYINNCDFVAAEATVKKILEAVPHDSDALETYKNLQDWKYLEIINGFLIRYRGMADSLVLPEGIREIGAEAFGWGRKINGESEKPSPVKRVVLSNSVTRINGESYKGAFANCQFLEEVVLQDGLVEIGDNAFSDCINLSRINIPTSVKHIGKNAFSGCVSLRGQIVLDGIETIGDWAFQGCSSLNKIVLGKSLTAYGEHAFQFYEYPLLLPEDYHPTSKEQVEIENRSSLVIDSERVTGIMDRKLAQRRAEQERKKEEQARWRSLALCQHCGGEFKGLFTKVCSKCGKPKDY